MFLRRKENLVQVRINFGLDNIILGYFLYIFCFDLQRESKFIFNHYPYHWNRSAEGCQILISNANNRSPLLLHIPNLTLHFLLAGSIISFVSTGRNSSIGLPYLTWLLMKSPNLQVVKGFKSAERCMLLKFVTSCSRAPLLGFKHLQPAFTIHKVLRIGPLHLISYNCLFTISIDAVDF